MSNGSTFFWLSVLFRIIQGIASASIQLCAYSFATSEMKSQKDLYIGYVEMALGVGDMVGPAIGGLAYEAFGFEGTFGVFGAMILVGIILAVIWIPSSLNVKIQ